jgi:hypothetical protein
MWSFCLKEDEIQVSDDGVKRDIHTLIDLDHEGSQRATANLR